MVMLSTERKFVGPGLQAEAAFRVADHYCVPDPEHPIGSIASVYYDTPRLTAFAEKEEGDHLKKKVRLRWYAEDKAGPDRRHTVFLECKHRVGGARFKQRAAFTTDYDRLDRAPLTDPYWGRLLAEGADRLDDSLPLELVPVICIRYSRRRYVCPRSLARIAVDTQVRVDRLNRDILPGAVPSRLEVTICEFKNRRAGDMPWAHALAACGFRLVSFSKYGHCIGRALNGGV
jgi:hypothetical protein